MIKMGVDITCNRDPDRTPLCRRIHFGVASDLFDIRISLTVRRSLAKPATCLLTVSVF